MKEPFDIWAIRQALQGWPFPRGRGLVLRAAHRRLARRDFPLVIGRTAAIAPDLDDWIVRHALEGGHRRDPAFQFSFRLLKPGDMAIDVGANIGLWSLLAAEHVGDVGQIWAFEAMPQTAERLRRNWELSGRPGSVTIFDQAVGATSGDVTIHESSPGDSSTAAMRPLAQGGAAVQVRCVALDDVWNQAGKPNVRLVKVDVEGAESQVIAGARGLLRNTSATVVFECDTEFLQESGSSPAELFSLLADCDRSVRTLHGDRVQKPPKGHCDLVAVPVRT